VGAFRFRRPVSLQDGKRDVQVAVARCVVWGEDSRAPIRASALLCGFREAHLAGPIVSALRSPIPLQQRPKRTRGHDGDDRR
jgi:hypothetical protein